jgi:hypothetical protein
MQNNVFIHIEVTSDNKVVEFSTSSTQDSKIAYSHRREEENGDHVYLPDKAYVKVIGEHTIEEPDFWHLKELTYSNEIDGFDVKEGKVGFKWLHERLVDLNKEKAKSTDGNTRRILSSYF